MSVGVTPSLKTIADIIGDIAPHSMSEMYGLIFADGSSSPASGTISLSVFRNKNFDATAPVITLIGDNPYRLIIGTTYVDPSATADGGETVTVDTSELNVAVYGTYTVTYSATDLAGNIGTVSRTVIVDAITERAKLLASDAAASDNFGFGVAISGDYVIVGARGKNGGAGSAYIFCRTDINTWDAGVKILASDAAAGDFFGYSVAVSGDYAIIGAPLNDDVGTSTGSAYIFRRTDINTWDAGVKILASDKGAGDKFGDSVSISGDYAIIGAPQNNDNGTYSGSAYVFRRTGTNTWDRGTKILAPDAATTDRFGISVSISGDYAIVGAQLNDDKGKDSGSAYVFSRTAINTWDAGTKILAPDGAAGDYFGFSVAISGDYAIVGAPRNGHAGTFSGSASIFHRTGTNTWDAGTRIIAPDAAVAPAFQQFGYSVAISGDNAIVGTTRDNVYIFHRTGTNTWDAGTKIVGSDVVTGDYFGSRVAISGDYAIAGAMFHTDVGTKSGSAYIFS